MREICTLGSAWGDEFKRPRSLGEGTGAKASDNSEAPQRTTASRLVSTILLDEWFENEVKPRLRGNSTLARFADDAVLAFADFRDTQRVLAVLGKRLAGMGSRSIPTRRASSISAATDQMGRHHPETDGTSFTFLGFCHVWGKSREGKNIVRQVTAKKRYARALAAVTAWCRKSRHLY